MPTTHVFEPTTYHRTLGQHAPVLTIGSGDTVQTSTVCAGGRGRSGEMETEGGNPQTGPFAIKGAEPGDVLAVRLDRIVPNRPVGWSSMMLAANVVEPHYVRKIEATADISLWDIDLEARTATLQTPETSLGRFTLPLDQCLAASAWRRRVARRSAPRLRS